ncbi:hypothetical protein [Nostoc sp. CMAA1605]|uniref:hypothetical protein n=1 Tax=Nostoc sp. CMAA1605 TaxID=2055159 RepID=UPI001F473459|nr:hypothetical protein [Nostoc sp. CMAA1605]
MGTGDWGLGTGETKRTRETRETRKVDFTPMLYALFPMRYAQCPMPYSQCPIPYSQIIEVDCNYERGWLLR